MPCFDRLSGLARPAIALAALLALTSHTMAQGTVKATHGDWQIRCDTPPGRP